MHSFINQIQVVGFDKSLVLSTNSKSLIESLTKKFYAISQLTNPGIIKDIGEKKIIIATFFYNEKAI